MKLWIYYIRPAKDIEFDLDVQGCYKKKKERAHVWVAERVKKRRRYNAKRTTTVESSLLVEDQ